ncbi:hypothetical protein F183_A55260 (plasmid) [Bryobacterales bacterium F-183]|nr:hypothetical protein F183_A55260 [Bryobacterales bacterium F-183]
MFRIALLVGVSSILMMANGRQPGPACAPFLDNEDLHWRGETRMSRVTDCIAEIGMSDYPIAKEVLKTLNGPRDENASHRVKAVNSAMLSYNVSTAVHAEFGRACESLKYIRKPDPEWDSLFPYERLASLADLMGCIHSLRTYHMDEAKKAAIYYQALVEQGVTTPLKGSATEEQLVHFAAALRYAFGYNPPIVLGDGTDNKASAPSAPSRPDQVPSTASGSAPPTVQNATPIPASPANDARSEIATSAATNKVWQGLTFLGWLILVAFFTLLVMAATYKFMPKQPIVNVNLAGYYPNPKSALPSATIHLLEDGSPTNRGNQP